jgi:hypothetical protein
MSQIIKPSSGGGGGGIIQTILGDTGPGITGPIVTIFANNATLQAGSSVLFNNSGTVSTLEVTDARGNTIIGKGSGNLTNICTNNVSLGSNNLPVLSNLGDGTGNVAIGIGNFTKNNFSENNVGIGNGNLIGLITGTGSNISIGTNCGQNITDGERNIYLGAFSGNNHTSAESENICISNLGVIGDLNTIRIGTQGFLAGEQDKCFIAGIVGVTTSNSEMVTIDSTSGQLGVAALPSPVAFRAFLSGNTGALTGDNLIPWDTASFNVGGNFNPLTSLFTAIDAGIYHFDVSLFMNSVASTFFISYFNSSVGGNYQNFDMNPASLVETNTNVVLSGGMTISMAAGETIGVHMDVVAGSLIMSGTANNSCFSGYKVA